MGPERRYEKDGHRVEEFYWHMPDRWVVYIDDKKTGMSYEKARKFIDGKTGDLKDAG